MKSNNAESYTEFFKNEPKTAAYLGYTDIAEFCKFRFSDPVIEAFLLHQEYCQNWTAKTSLQMIECSSNFKDEFSADIKVMLAKYLSDPDVNIWSQTFCDSIYITVIYRLTETIEAMSSMSVQDLTDRQAQVSSKFKAVFTTFILLTIDITMLQYSRLEPFHNIREIDLEKYSCVNALLKSLQCAIAPSWWNEMFEKAGFNLFVLTQISADSTSSWMWAADSTANLSLMTMSLTQFLHLKKTFTLFLDRSQWTKYSVTLNQHINNFIIFNSLHLLLQLCLAAKDPHAFPTGKIWCDTVCRQLNLMTLQVNFLLIHICDSDSVSAQRMLIYDSYLLDEVKLWTDVLAFLKSSVSVFYIMYTLQVVDMNADNNYYEYNDLSLAVQEEFEVMIDHNIELQQLSLRDSQQGQKNEQTSTDEQQNLNAANLSSTATDCMT